MGMKLGISSLTLWTEHRLRAFKNTILRKIFEPMRNMVTGGWRKMHSEKLHFYTLPNTILYYYYYYYYDQIKHELMETEENAH